MKRCQSILLNYPNVNTDQAVAAFKVDVAKNEKHRLEKAAGMPQYLINATRLMNERKDWVNLPVRRQNTCVEKPS